MSHDLQRLLQVFVHHTYHYTIEWHSCNGDLIQLLLFAPNVKEEWVDSKFQIIDLLVQPRVAGVAGTLIFVHIAFFATLQLDWLALHLKVGSEID